MLRTLIFFSHLGTNENQQESCQKVHPLKRQGKWSGKRRALGIALDLWLCFRSHKIHLVMPKGGAREKPGRKLVAENRQIPFRYHILERFEAGLVLTGTEVKALREGRVNLRDAFAQVRRGEIWLMNCHISSYSHAGYAAHDVLRMRKLLLQKEQIEKLAGRVEQKGLTLVPTRVYFKNGRAKCEIALVKGKKVWDRREEIRRRTAQREIEQELKKYR